MYFIFILVGKSEGTVVPKRSDISETNLNHKSQVPEEGVEEEEEQQEKRKLISFFIILSLIL